VNNMQQTRTHNATKTKIRYA